MRIIILAFVAFVGVPVVARVPESAATAPPPRFCQISTQLWCFRNVDRISLLDADDHRIWTFWQGSSRQPRHDPIRIRESYGCGVTRPGPVALTQKILRTAGGGEHSTFRTNRIAELTFVIGQRMPDEAANCSITISAQLSESLSEKEFREVVASSIQVSDASGNYATPIGALIDLATPFE